MPTETQNKLPQGWAWTTIGEIVFINPGWWDADLLEDSEYVSFVPMAAVEEATGRLDPSQSKKWAEVKQGFKRFQENDVLFAKITPSMENGKFALAVNLFEGIGTGSTEFHVLRPTKVVQPKLILYYLLQQTFRRRARSVMKGAAGQLRVPQEFLAQEKFPLPPLEEQHRIIATIETQFTRLDVAEANLKRTKVNLERLRASTLTAACEGKLVPTESELDRVAESNFESGKQLLKRILHERREKWEAAQLGRLETQGKIPKNDKWKAKYIEPIEPETSTLPELPTGWVWATLDQLSWDSSYGTSDRSDYEFTGLPILRIPNISNGHISIDDLKRAKPYLNIDQESILKVGDFLIVRTNGSKDLIGRGALTRTPFDEPYYFASYLIRFRFLGEAITQEWISLQWNSVRIRKWIESKAATTAGQYNISLSTLKSMCVAIPPLADQRRIVIEIDRRFSIIDGLKNLVEANLKRAETLRQKILQDAFDGLLGPQSSSDTPAINLLEQAKVEKHENANRKMIQRRPVKGNSRLRSAEPTQDQIPLPFEVGALKPVTLKRSGVRNMKLISLETEGDYKSLRNFNQTFRIDDGSNTSLSPICLVGLNGSGKSNLIELLSEIFCYLELSNLPYERLPLRAKQTDLRFKIEYDLRVGKSKEIRRIQVNKLDAGPPIYTEITKGVEKTIEGSKSQLEVLPAWVIGYSSGLNETVSVPYFITKAFYSEEVRNQAFDESDLNQQAIADARTLFLDYESTAAILLSNYLFSNETQLEPFRQHIRIEDVASFKINIQLTYGSKKQVKLTKELENAIALLQECASEVHSDKGGDRITFTYNVTRKTKSAFRKYFVDAKSFFNAIYKLSLLNALALKSDERKFYLREDVKEGLVERPPTVSKEDRIFDIEHLQLQLTEPKKIIDYAGISDGEHQFIHIFGTVKLFDEAGCLFVFDEPESHFNPQWRRHFVQILDDMPSTRNQEFVISTHSPFIVSGCRGENVFKFERKGDVALCKRVDFETFGSSFEFLLTELFDLKALISEQAFEELKGVLQSNDLNKLEAAVSHFGESFEKRFLFEKIARIKNKKK
jgi:type I restriction enzyme S subunit